MSTTDQNVRDFNGPSPIIVYGVANIRPVQDLLQEIVGDEYSMKVLANDQVEIQLKDKGKIEALAAGLRSKNTIFEIDKKKKDDTYKVALRNMHPSMDTESIAKEMELHGHKVISITNVKDEVTQEPMPLFHIELELRENNEDIFALTKLSNMIVAFEPLNERKTLLRCTKCQSIGHTNTNCVNVAEEPNDDAVADPTEATETPTSTNDTPIAYVQPIRSRAPKNRRLNPPNPPPAAASSSYSSGPSYSFTFSSSTYPAPSSSFPPYSSSASFNNSAPTSTSTSANHHGYSDTIREQMATLDRLNNLESVVNSTISSLESMLLLTSTLNQRLR